MPFLPVAFFRPPIQSLAYPRGDVGVDPTGFSQLNNDQRAAKQRRKSTETTSLESETMMFPTKENWVYERKSLTLH